MCLNSLFYCLTYLQVFARSTSLRYSPIRNQPAPPPPPPQVWSEMTQSGVKPSAHAWSSRVDAHARGGRMRRALKLGKEMREAGHPWGVETYTSLIAGSIRKRSYSG